MNDDFLTRFRKPPRPEFAAALYQRISKPMNSQFKHRALRYSALTVAVLVVMILTVLYFPPAHALAQGLLKQVGGYAFSPGVQQPDSGRTPSQIGILRTLDSVSIVTYGDVPTAHDVATATRMAGFSVLTPHYLPAGYSAMSGWFIASDNGTVVSNGYRDTANHFFVINQWKSGERALKQYAKEQIIAVTIHGNPGVWLPDTSSGPAQKNALVWEETGITYSLITDSLLLDELRKVAESLSR